MKLSFYAKGDLLVSMPGQVLHRRNADTGASGAPPRYVGREYVAAELRQEGERWIVLKKASFPASREPYTCDSEGDKGRRLMRLVRRDGSLWPADKATADACSVPFVETVFVDGEHVAKNKTQAPASPAPAVKKQDA